MAACGGSAGGGGGAGGGTLPPVPCCGCLCADATWSCTKDTCLTPEGKAEKLIPEAGFFELPGADYVSYDGPGQSPRARVWYSFQPAETDPENKPLMIIFNGPPGPALGVLAFNIGHYTFDSDYTSGADFADNPSRWTDFANLLYVDTPGGGYSYFLPRADGSTPAVDWDAYADAADFLRVLFRFAERHPQLAKSEILITGESGGGLRASHIGKILLDYPTLVAGGRYQDPELYAEIVAFLGSRRTDIAATDWKPADIVELLTHLVLIDPYLSSNQWKNLTTLQMMPPAGCVPNPDVLQCDVTEAQFQPVFDHLVRVGTDPAILSQVLRSDMTSIEWMHASARAGAYERHERLKSSVIDQTKLVEVFGALEKGDSYFVFDAANIHETWDIGPAPVFPENVEHGPTVLRTLYDIPTIITNGQYDLAFNSQFLDDAFAPYTDVLTSATHDLTQPSGVARPGQLVLVYKDVAYGPAATKVIPLPAYAAGHSVSHGSPAELKADVASFVTTSALP